jgi:hypothetical protein
MNTATGLRMLENVLTIFIDAGFDAEMAARLFRAFGYYVAGAALDEAAGYARGHTAMEPVPDDVAAAEYPLVTAVNPFFNRAHHQATFDLGLDIVLTGISRVHEATVGKKPEAGGAAKRQPVARRAARAIIT